jgi:hypothetical protein
MRDPKRLLEEPGSDLDVVLLQSGLDEAPPSRLVERTLLAVGALSATTAGASAAAGTAAGAGASSATSASSGWLGATLSKLGLAGKALGGVGLAIAVAGGGGAVYFAASGPAAETSAVAPPAAEPAPPPAAQTANEREAPPPPAPLLDAPSGASPADVKQPGEGAVRRPPAQKAPPSSPAHPGKPSGGSLTEETALLDAARASLRAGDKAGARAKLDAYAARFPNGEHRPEAAALRARLGD